MSIKQQELKNMLKSVSKVWLEHCDYLCEIDSRFGDGDHGVTIRKIAQLLTRESDSWTDASMYEFIDSLGSGTMGVNGGSAGPLYGTMIGGLSIPLKGVEEIDGSILKQMLQHSLSEMQDITTAKVGDKTMMDALIPAVEAANRAGDSIGEILQCASDAATKGAKESENYVSKFGRARSYKEQTIGTPDAGAISTALFFQGLLEGIK